MPKVQKPSDFLQRLAVVEEQLAALQRSGWERDELPFYPTSLNGMVYEDDTTFITLWETVLTPRSASLALGLVLLGDQVDNTTNTGGEWQVLFDSTVVASGSVPATFSYVFPALTLDLTPYRAATQLKVAVQVRRTSGATAGGKYGGGGCIGGSPRYARLL
ncbi:hypothetical protein [Streptomyces shenzhenensis]|uniref:Uncharacterized protein n=1 Tax=Streptomyces shenzhenensis TaxID=943815 RepID=A0A3M0IB94_9ACTN|nr:hypothetical protein [Streptomyces shenzhenensis]RMB85628.1 hypothetical protein CTZ28_12640 [Streptomyces shenzhenensis]